MNYSGYIYMFIHICVFVIIIKERVYNFENEKEAAWEVLEGEEEWGKWYIYILSKPEIN